MKGKMMENTRIRAIGYRCKERLFRGMNKLQNDVMCCIMNKDIKWMSYVGNGRRRSGRKEYHAAG